MAEKIILTFDLEYWFESLVVQKYLSGNEKDDVGPFINKVLGLLTKTNSTATFFTNGKILDNEPGAIKKIFDAGHEIAIHSLDHKPLWQKTPAQFDAEIKEMVAKIKGLTGKRPIGHRAVNFSLDKKTVWALKILADNQLKYDSSIFPLKLPSALFALFKMNPYGAKTNLISPHKLDDSPLFEIPLAVYRRGFFRFPLGGGGIYIRLIPWSIFKILLKSKLKKEVACLYFHPFDFLEKCPDIKMPKSKKFIKYFNTKNTWPKLEYIIKNFQCLSIEKYLQYESSFA